MVNIDIEIIPTLNFNEELMKNAVSTNPEDLKRFWFEAMRELDDLEKRLNLYIDSFVKFFAAKAWKKDILEMFGLQILKFAEWNASEGYTSTEYLTKQDGSKDTVFKKRAEVVQRLYNLAGYGEPSGLTTGADKLIDSLRPSADNNIFEIRPNNEEVIVGTRYEDARVLEDGGMRDLWQWEQTHLGVSIDQKTGKLKPAKWLVDAIGSYDAAWKLIDELFSLIYSTDAYIPPRAFLKPALWSVRYDKETISEFVQAIYEGLLMNSRSALIQTKSNDVIDISVESIELGGTL